MNHAIREEFASHVSPSQDPVRWLHLYQLLSGVLAAGVPGAVVEIGCNEGHTSILLRRILDYYQSDRALYLYDSFAGMGEWQGADDGSHPTVERGMLQTTQQVVLKKFRQRGLTPPSMHPGWVEDTLPDQLPSKIAFALVDVDLYGPIKHALAAVYDRVPAGGVIVIDDYRWKGTPGAMPATDEFFADQPEAPQLLPMAVSAFVRKGCPACRHVEALAAAA